jgi:zeta-carotene desaturase
VGAAEAALRRYFPAMKDATVTRSLVLREAEATFSCGPEAEKLRFGPRTPVPSLFVAGDWTPTGLPATIEGAVRSGFAAAVAAEKGWEGVRAAVPAPQGPARSLDRTRAPAEGPSSS